MLTCIQQSNSARNQAQQEAIIFDSFLTDEETIAEFSRSDSSSYPFFPPIFSALELRVIKGVVASPQASRLRLGAPATLAPFSPPPKTPPKPMTMYQPV